MRWVVEFGAAVLTLAIATLFSVVGFTAGERSMPIPAGYLVGCTAGVVSIGFLTGLITGRFPWPSMLLVAVAIAGFAFTVPGVSMNLGTIFEALELPACATSALAIGALLAAVWRVAKGRESA
jgi:hypothetical protein